MVSAATGALSTSAARTATEPTRGAAARVTRDVEWSRDGKRIAFSAGPAGTATNFEIYAIDADGSNERQLTTHPAYDVRPTWAPDGRRLAFVSERSGASDVYVMNADGSSLVRVTHTPWAEEKPAWAADGRWLAVGASPAGHFDIYVYDLTRALARREP